MGFDPYRAHRRSVTDVVVVVAAFALVVALVAWALVG